MILLLVHMVISGIQRMIAWIAAQSTPRLILLFQAMLLVLYLALAAVAAFFLPSQFVVEAAIKVPVSVDKVLDHIEDIQKNPLSGSHRIRTRRLSELKWEEEIGSNETLRCHQHEQTAKDNNRAKDGDHDTGSRRLVRDFWADTVNMKGQVIYLLTTTTTRNNKTDEKETPQQTILRMFVTVEAPWGSFWTPLLRLVLTQKQEVLEHTSKDYLDRLCKDMGAPSQKAEAWE